MIKIVSLSKIVCEKMINIIRTELSPLFLNDIAINALPVMEEYKIGHIPIINHQNKIVGLIDESSILNMNNLQDPLSLIKHECRNISISKYSHFFQAINIFCEHDISLLPIVNSDNTYLGYILPNDIIKKIGIMAPNDINTSIITLSIKQKDYTLQEMTRLIEENNGKIISLWSELNKHKIEIHILINCINFKIIIKTLERYGYKLIRTFSNNVEPNNLDDRFESFIKYLNP